MENSWSGTIWHCPCCGAVLVEEEKPEEKYFDDFKNEKEYNKYLDSLTDSFYYHCSNDKCYYHLDSFYVFFHPLRGIKSAPGESWAFGFVK